MRAVLVKFGDVALEFRAAASPAPEFEGGNRYVRDFVRATEASDVLMLSLGESDSAMRDGRVNAYAKRLRPVPGGLFGRVELALGVGWLRSQILRFHPDIVVCLDTGPPAAMCARVCESLSARLVVVATTDIAGTGRGRRLRVRDAVRALGSDSTLAVLACSSAIRSQVEPLVRSGVVVTVYHPDYRLLAAADSLAVSSSERSRDVVFVGRLAAVKGSDRIGGIARAAADAGGRLVVIGDGPDMDAVRAEVATIGLEAAVEFAGTLPHRKVMDRMAGARAVVVPSRSEGVAKVAIEALIAGTPVVAFGVGGIGDVVIDGANGRLVPAGDLVAFHGAVSEVLNDDEEWRSLVHGAESSRDELINRGPTFGEALRVVLGGGGT